MLMNKFLISIRSYGNKHSKANIIKENYFAATEFILMRKRFGLVYQKMFQILIVSKKFMTI